MCSASKVNRDIKLENSLIDTNKKPIIKICDFGYSKSELDSAPKSKVGTPGYTGEIFGFSSQEVATVKRLMAPYDPIAGVHRPAGV